MQLDFDVQRTTASVGSGPRIYFHTRTSSGASAAKGYWISYLDDYNTDGDGLTLTRKAADYGTETRIGVAKITLDLNPHHVRMIDDGVGHMRLYFDDMNTPCLIVDDSGANYVGADNTYMGLGYTGQVDNIQVSGDDPPAAVTDLATSNPDWFKLDLSWTAPTDFPIGPAASYDIRYSTGTITEANWAAATQVVGEPTPAQPGQHQTMTISGLQASTTYYFALKSTDAGGKISGISNCPFGTTNPLDVVAPAAVTDLGSNTVRASRATLTWTATGDDGTTGLASQYDIRYATVPLTEANWAAASQATGMPVPKAPGSAETFILHGLTPLTTYYVAIKVADEVPNWSAISNVVTFATLEPDPYPPLAIGDLRLTGTYIHSAFLMWTAPADVGNTGTGAYDVRYSTSPITEANWASATQATGIAAPSAPGTVEHVTVNGLQPSTTYFFSVKTLDQAEPPNTSAISNVVTGHTLPPVAAVTIHNPWISNDRVADCHSLTTMANTFCNAYTPDGVVAPAAADTETIVINNYNNFKRRLYHWGEMPPNNADVGYQLNVFGWALCGSQASMNAAIIKTMGLSPRTISIASGGHTYMEVNYNGKWHAIDTMCTYYVYDRGNPRSLACEADVKADHTLVMNAVAEGRACPGFLLCGDTPDYFATGADTWQVKATPGDTPTIFSTNMDIRMGEALKRTCESWLNQWPSTSTTPPYHHEAANDWKDTVNLPYWEPYAMNTAQNATIGITYSMTYRRWANGTISLAPDFRSAGYQASLLSSTNIATFNDDGLTPDLHAAVAGSLANAVFKIATPFYITDATVSGTFFKNAASDINRVYVSTDGTTFTKVWDNAAVGTTQLTNLDLRTQVYNTYAIWIKVELQATTAKTDAGVSNLVITPTFEHNKGGMAYLDKGVNHITVTCDNPQDLASGAALHVTYKWKEYDGANWTIDRSYDAYVNSSPATFTVTTGGTKVPRTEYIQLEVTPPPMPCDNPPSPVTDLAVTGTDSTAVSLSWTASADPCHSGQACASYDIRYSTSPIDAGSFDAAPAVANSPVPQAPGLAENFTVTGLSPSTAYYFAMKVHAVGGNISDMSNIVPATTLAPDITPPAWVEDLVAASSKTTGAVDLTWTAAGDDGNVGTAAGYDLRYSTSPITDDASFAAATHVTGLPAPKATGSAESFTVTGLIGGSFHYFALKVSDESGNVSEVSNSTYAFASVLGEKTLQYGLSGYTGTKDNYTEASSATTNYGSNSRMRICGYADGGITNVQRGFIRFDVSSIPAGTTITSAKLYLYAYDQTYLRGSTGFYAVYPLTRTWDEMTSCWNLAQTGTNWTTPGGDFLSTPDGTSPKQAVINVWYPFSVTARVQAWINGGSTNYGWCVRCLDEDNHNQDCFYQLDTPNAAQRPTLVVSDLPVAVTGDIDGDGHVDVVDLLFFVDSFGLVLGDRGYDPKCDLNHDGSVDVIDLLTMVENWGV